MTTKKNIEVKPAEREDLYQEYIKKMLELGYATFVIGEELAILTHAMNVGQD